MTSRDKEKGVNVEVILRCRPFSSDELRSNAPQVVTCNHSQREVAVSQNIAGKHSDKVFTFDKVFGPSSTQRELYDQVITPIVNEVLEGFNCTIFAYGQTETGNTYTMEANCKNTKNGGLPAEAGVIPRAIKQIFDTLEKQNDEYSVKVTFLELYNEEITDLLAPEDICKVAVEDRQKKQLTLMEDGKGGVLVRGLEEVIVTTSSEIFTLLKRGSAKRRTAETHLNKQSSRSHLMFSITIHIKEATPEGEELIKCGKLNLVDLAGSENISRSGAREGHSREAGEINKSLLTLERVISALVEHLGHVPYRDSKLTRLLRDSLGGRTKTCIIATVSPAVHCLEETLSTLDYAHRVKHIRNKPEVSQKMMKSTLLKDLYNEIDRLKGEVYATREKCGVYIPKERYYQESERKAMAEQIEQIENHQKQQKELQSRYDFEVDECHMLLRKLDSTKNDLSLTRKMLAGTKEELKRQDTLAQQASVLRLDIEKSFQDNAALYSKIEREDKLSSENKSVVVSYQAELARRLGSLCSTVAGSTSNQNEYLQSIDKHCQSLLTAHEAVAALKKKLESSRSLYISDVEELQNLVRRHKAGSDVCLDELSSSVLANANSIEKFLSGESGVASKIYDDLQAALSSHQGEVALFASELREITEEVGKLGGHASQAEEVQVNIITGFEKEFEEQTKSDAEKLISDVTNLVTSHMRRQNEMVGARLINLREAAVVNKSFLDGHVSSVGTITYDAKRKWHDFYEQAESDANEGVNFSAAKHCRMELLLQQCAGAADSAASHWNKTQGSLTKMCKEQASSLVSNIRSVNEQHTSEIDSARATAEQDAVNSSEEIVQHFDGLTAREQEVIAGISSVVKSLKKEIQVFREDHSGQASNIEKEAHNTFQQHYMDYEPTGTTPVRCEPEVPSKGTIEYLRAMPSRIPRPPLVTYGDYDPTGTTPVRCEPEVPSKGTIEYLRAMPSRIPRPPLVTYGDYDPTGTTPVRCEPEVPSKGTIEYLRAMPSRIPRPPLVTYGVKPQLY